MCVCVCVCAFMYAWVCGGVGGGVSGCEGVLRLHSEETTLHKKTISTAFQIILILNVQIHLSSI